MIHPTVVECVKQVENISSGEFVVNGRIDAGDSQRGIEVELSGSPSNLVWAMTKLTRVEDGTLYVLPQHLEKAEKYKEIYGFQTKIKEIPECCR
ncbi:hypothetical protein ES703_105189 [subsurface metagenome]